MGSADFRLNLPQRHKISFSLEKCLIDLSIFCILSPEKFSKSNLPTRFISIIFKIVIVSLQYLVFFFKYCVYNNYNCLLLCKFSIMSKHFLEVFVSQKKNICIQI